MQTNQFRNIIIVLGILIIALLRFALLDYANFAPVAAAGIFGIYFLQKKQWAIVFALIAFFVSDLVLQATKGYGLYWERGFDYFALAAALGLAWFVLRKRLNLGQAIIGAFVGSIVFFLVSNFGVWALGTMYAKTPAGLLTCYEMGLPFYRGTLLGDVAFTGLFVGGFELLTKAVPQLQLKEA